MKRILIISALISLALMSVSCTKDTPGNGLTIDWDNRAKTTFTTKSDQYEDSVTAFSDISVSKTSEFEGKSWFFAISDGKLVHNAFVLSLYFDDINRLKVGEKLPISKFLFSFVFSNDSNATTNTYRGSVYLVEKADDHVVLHFQNFRFSCSFGDYVTNGYLYCPLREHSIQE